MLADGTHAERQVGNTGGTRIDHAMVDYGSNPALVWVERNGAASVGPLRVVPACNL